MTKQQKNNSYSQRDIRRLASALNEVCMNNMGVGLSVSQIEAKIIISVVKDGKTYKQAERQLYPE